MRVKLLVDWRGGTSCVHCYITIGIIPYNLTDMTHLSHDFGNKYYDIVVYARTAHLCGDKPGKRAVRVVMCH